MSNERAILVVDSNEGFAALLKESLEQSGGYRVALTTNGNDALQTLSSFPFDLAIVDLGLENPDGITLAHKMRQQQADLRLMLIPIQGEEIPSKTIDLDIQGILPKPFFLPELPGRISEALSRSVKAPTSKAEATPADTGPLEELKEVAAPKEQAPPPAQPARPAQPTQPSSSSEVLSSVRERMPELVKRMNVLAQEVNADTVILTCKGRVISHTGRLSAEGAVGLAQAIAESCRTSTRVAQILGQELERFEQSTEGGNHLFYSLAVVEDIILSVALRGNVPLGMLRHRTKEAADNLRTLLTG
jgi:CheY-like chemotaxis protein